MGRYSVVMAAGFFLLILFMSSPGAVARTIYVDVSNHGDPSMNGSAAHPYDGISKAVDNASTSDLVIVANGTYNESVTIDRAITVRGNGSTVVSPGSSGVAITIDENYVTVDGLNITHAKYGIEVSADHATLWNLTIENCQHGIHIQSHSDIAIANVTITDSKEGLWITGSSHITLTDVEATDNEDDGVYLSLTDNCTIDGGRFSDNDQRGIFLESSGGDIVIRDCEVRDNDYYGIAMVSDSSGNRIEGVTVSGSAWGLYFFSNSDDNTVIGSTVTGNDVNIYIRNCDGETIKASDVGGGTTRNIHLFNSEGNRIIDSDALPGSVLLEFQSDLVATNTSIWNEVIDDEDSRLVVRNWVIVRVVTSPPSSFGIEDADVRIVDRNGTDNRTVFATPHFGGTNATTDPDGWSARVLVLTRLVRSSSLDVHNHTFDVHYYGWTNATAEATVTISGETFGPGNFTAVNVNGSTSVVFEYPLVVYYGDVVINTTVSWNALSVIIFGNLTIGPAGNMSIVNTHLWIGSDGWTCHIEILDGGRLTVTDGDGDPGTENDASVISPLGNQTFSGIPTEATPSLLFWARSGSTLRVSNSILAGLGSPDGVNLTDIGLYVRTHAISLTSVNISYSRVGLVLHELADITVEGLMFNGDGTGVAAYNCTNITLRNMSFGDSQIGVSLHGSDSINVSGSPFAGCNQGIVVDNTSVVLEDNTMEDVSIGVNASGSRYLRILNMSVAGGGTAVLLRPSGTSSMPVVMSNASISSMQEGLNVSGDARLDISEVTVVNCTTGFSLEDTTRRFHVTNVSFYGPATGTGIALRGVANGDMTNVTFTALSTGLSAADSTRLDVVELTATGCYRAVYLTNTSDADMQALDIALAGPLGATGLRGIDVTDLTLTTLTISDGATGIDLINGSGVEVHDLNVTGTIKGVEIAGTEDVLLSGADLIGCSDAVVSEGTRVLIEGATIDRCTVGVVLGGERSAVDGCTITDFTDGIVASGSGHRISENQISGGARGIVLSGLTGSRIFGNTIADCQHGIRISYSFDNTLASNAITKDDAAYGIYLTGDGLYNAIARNNTVGGVKVRYYHAQDWQMTVSSLFMAVPRMTNVGQVVIVNCSYTMSLQSSNITGGDVGLAIIDSVGVQVSDTDLVGNEVGIRIIDSSEVTVQYTGIWRSTDGVSITGSNKVMFDLNGTIAKCVDGMDIADSSGITVSKGIGLVDNDVAIRCFNVTKLKLDGTSSLLPTLSGNRIGITMEGGGDPMILRGRITGADVGIDMRDTTFVTLGEMEFYGCDVGIRADGVTGMEVEEGLTPLFELCGIGIHFKGATDVDMVGVEIGNSTQGVLAEGGSHIRLGSLRLRNGDTGVRVVGGREVWIDGLRFNGTGTGIILDGTSSASVNGSASADADTFLLLDGATDVSIRDNSVTNTGTGIDVRGSSEIVLTGNVLAYTATDPLGAPLQGQSGVCVVTSDGVHVTDMDILNFRQGIHIDNSTNVTVNDTAINGSAHRALSVRSTSILLERLTLYGNNCSLFLAGAAGTAVDLSVCEGATGIATTGSTIELRNATVSGVSEAGVQATASFLDMTEGEITDSAVGLRTNRGSTVSLTDLTIGLNEVGIEVENATLDGTDLSVEGNLVAIDQTLGSVNVSHSTLRSLEREATVIGGLLHIVSDRLPGDAPVIMAEDAVVFVFNCTSAGGEGPITGVDSDLTVERSVIRSDTIALNVSGGSVSIHDSTLAGEVTALGAAQANVAITHSAFEDGGKGIDLDGATVTALRLVLLEGCDIGIRARRSTLGGIDGLSFRNTTLDLSLDECGAFQATNTSISTWDFRNTTLSVMNYLRVRVMSFTTGSPMMEADVRVWGDSGTIYATPGFNGTDSRTDRNGYTPYILVDTLNFGSKGAVVRNSTGIEVKLGEWFIRDLAIDMSTSHTEVYRFPVSTFQTITYLDGDPGEAGTGQSGLIGTVLGRPLAVFVEDEKNRSVEGIAVVFEIVYPNGTDALLDPIQSFSDADGHAYCNVTLPTTGTNLTVKAYLKLDPLKYVLFELEALDIDVDLTISPSRHITTADAVEIKITTTPRCDEVYIDFGDGSSTGWTNETQFTHSYPVGDYEITVWVRAGGGLVSAPVTATIYVDPQIVTPPEERSSRSEIPAYAMPLIAVIVIAALVVGIVMGVPDLRKKVRLPTRRKTEEVEFLETSAEFTVEEEPARETTLFERPAPVLKPERAETLEDLILDLERHKPDEGGRKGLFVKKRVARPTGRAPGGKGRAPARSRPSERRKGGKR